ncbi:MAG: NAD(P)H-hydrate dehydratase [Novosphingobium sp.]|nr:NAD(P)H-hydrate dehydratase [Novosphingobium sp.]
MTGASNPVALDSDWLRANPLPEPSNEADKNERGRVLAIGGGRNVPGGVRLTAEAALRAGAGKVRVATVESAAILLGVAMPEIAVFGLPEDPDGEIGGNCGRVLSPLLEHADAIVLGPAISGDGAAGGVVDHLLAADSCTAPLILDAAALTCLPPDRIAPLRGRRHPAILTPHIGEMAGMLDCDAAEIDADRARATRSAARAFGATCVLKGATTLVATPEGALYACAGGGVGLATGGSGDVLAGIVAGLAARGAEPLTATLWAVWLHGEAGRRCAERQGPLGYLARELLAEVPRLMRAL